MNPYPVGMNPYPLGMEPYPLGMDPYLLGMDPYLGRNAHSDLFLYSVKHPNILYFLNVFL